MFMKHHYSTVDEIVTTFSDIYSSEKNGESILVYFERPSKNGFDIAEYLLPSITCNKCIGFTENENLKLERYVLLNSPLIWEIAREDGEIIYDKQ